MMPTKSTSAKDQNAQNKALKHTSSAAPQNQSFPVLALAVLGVVYGDIGTSPIYALRECFAGKHPIPISTGNVLGILSLIFWTLILVISLKYMVYVLRADNRGEGGTFALLALLRPDRQQTRWIRRVLILLGLLGASMLYGGAMITPAISVLSAVEGLQLATPGLQSYVIPITVIILILLFSLQSFGTAKVGAAFGPITLIWFVVLALLGIRGIVHAPVVLLAINPWYAVKFFLENGMTGYFVLYAVFLVTTGGEALYADMGHFGRQPIRKVWFRFVLPALLINYFGQGALLIAEPAASIHPRHGRDHHRFTGSNYGCLFADTAGSATWSVSAAHREADLRRCARTNLLACSELDTDDGRNRPGACISFVGKSCRSLRCGGQLHHGGHDDTCVQRRA
jgi:KUP system potassium uptake protein